MRTLLTAVGGCQNGRATKRAALSEPSLYDWRPTLQERDACQSAQPAAFVPVIPWVEQAERDAGLVIELRGGRLLRLPGAIPAVRVAELVRALDAMEAIA